MGNVEAFLVLLTAAGVLITLWQGYVWLCHHHPVGASVVLGILDGLTRRRRRRR